MIPQTAKASEIAALTGLTGERVRQLVSEGKIPKPGKKGSFPFRKTIRAICQDLRDRLKGKSEVREGAKDRRETAEADTAELIAGEKAGSLVDAEDMRLRWLDRALEIRRAVESADYLKPQQKTLLLADMAKIKAPDKDRGKIVTQAKRMICDETRD